MANLTWPSLGQYLTGATHSIDMVPNLGKTFVDIWILSCWQNGRNQVIFFRHNRIYILTNITDIACHFFRYWNINIRWNICRLVWPNQIFTFCGTCLSVILLEIEKLLNVILLHTLTFLPFCCWERCNPINDRCWYITMGFLSASAHAVTRV